MHILNILSAIENDRKRAQKLFIWRLHKDFLFILGDFDLLKKQLLIYEIPKEKRFAIACSEINK